MANKKPPLKTVLKVFRKLKEIYPNSKTELTYEGPFQLLISVILSAQCTDERVNQTTPALFKEFPTAETMAAASPKRIEKLIHSCGFYKAKTKSLINASKDIIERFNGEIPDELDDLVTLAGVGRKTASVVLNQAFDKPAIAVDTHVKRVSNRLGWATSSDPVKIEFELRELLPEKEWAPINGTLILHGRRICKARKPACELCPVSADCVYYSVKA